MKTCPSCGRENAPEQKFCGECGAQLGAVCPACEAPNPPENKFCGECGAPLAGSPQQAAIEPEPAAPPAAERRLVSVLFADLVGFTSASEKRDAEETRELLSRYFDTCRRLIELYGGTVEKFIGDAVMAVWGTPITTEDDAERAVRAALDLVAAVSALGDEIGAESLRARAGVLTGEAAVTIGAEGEGMVAGDVVNTASRIQSTAQPGKCLRRGRDTSRYRADDRLRECRARTSSRARRSLSRSSAPLRVVAGARGVAQGRGTRGAVRRPRPRAAPASRSPSTAPPTTARRISSRSSASPGSARAVSPGSSSSTSTDLPTTSPTGIAAAASPTERASTYWALADMVRMRCRHRRGRRHRRRRSRSCSAPLVEQSSTRRNGASSSRALAHLLGLEERHGLRARRSLRGMAALLRAPRRASTGGAWCSRTCSGRTTRCSTSSTTCSSGRGSYPIFVCTLARPELNERRPTWGSGSAASPRSTSSRWRTRRWSSCSTASCRDSRTSSRRRSCERAEGIPLYAVETVRMMLDRGVLVQDGPVYRPRRADHRARGARDAPRADRGAPRRARTPRSGAASRTQPCWARPSRARRSRRCPDSSEDELEPLLRRPRAARRSSPFRRNRAPRVRSVLVPPGPAPPRRLRDADEAGTAGPPPRRSRLSRASVRRTRTRSSKSSRPIT